MEQSKVISTAMKIQHVTNLNVYVLDQYGDLSYHLESISIPDFMPGSGEEAILDLHEKMVQEDQLYYYSNEWKLHYIGYSFIDKKDSYFIIIGPYFEQTLDFYRLTLEYKLSSKQSEELRMISDKIYILSEEEASSMASVLCQFKSMMTNEVTPITVVSEKTTRPEQMKVHHFDMDEEAELINLRYMIEKDFLHAVEQGDKTAALKLMNSNNLKFLFSFSERFPNQPMRRLKNLAIILNTLLRTAAGNSSVPALLIHRISDKYAYEIENAGQLAALYQLEDCMIEEYCDLVLSNSLKNYSTMTQKVIEYLLSFYDKQIDKEELASLCNVHSGHLSRKFKQQTNMTITEYQKILRLQQAKHLLKTENLPVEEVAWLVGYDDPSYFTRVFKKETGSTPTQFIEREVQ
ncbi:helix-turn-helix domain-containing protein [Halobacillus ihumii]|uniref:helix-turn-helix domain-containing protein n=1 Tax=Halobacillus ihumii TaxID=2686092 RepID=UPI0013D8A86B|nr:helix-turn-helix domain-containing protein [Halobacillus ihumii]